MINKIGILLITFLLLSSCNKDDSKIENINKEITDLTLKNKELESKLDLVISKIQSGEGIKYSDIKNLENDKNTPEYLKILKLYSESPTWKEKLNYVYEANKVKSIMESYYDSYYPSQINKKSLDSMVVKNLNEKLITINSEYYIVKINNTYKIDWLSSIGYNYKNLKDMEFENIKDSVKMRAKIRLGNYYNSNFPESKYLNIVVSNERKSYLSREVLANAFVEKDSIAGIKIKDIFKKNVYDNKALINIRYIEEEDQKYYLIEDLLHEGWQNESY